MASKTGASLSNLGCSRSRGWSSNCGGTWIRSRRPAVLVLTFLLVVGMMSSSVDPNGIAAADAASTVVNPLGQGYWMADQCCTVTGFGDAPTFGSFTGLTAVVGIAPTPTGKG